MTNLIHFRQVREDLLEAVMHTDGYKTLTRDLHEKYKDQYVNEDYPEAYWSEFHDQYEKLIVSYVCNQVDPTYKETETEKVDLLGMTRKMYDLIQEVTDINNELGAELNQAFQDVESIWANESD